MSYKNPLVKLAHDLADPIDYFNGLDWADEILPRQIVSFCRTQQDHCTSGWQGISAKAGRYDQHSRYVLLIPLQGSGRMGIESRIQSIKEGQSYLLFPHQIHYYIDLPDSFCWLFITFNLDTPNKRLLEAWKNEGRCVSEKSSELLQSFLELYQEGKSLRASVILGRVLRSLLRDPKSPRDPQPEVDLVARIKKHVMENLENNLAMPALSDAMGISESYLRAVFREEAGVSLGNFIRSIRLVRATYLLEEDRLDLTEIAEKTGFGSLTSFTRAFRRMYDMTPSSYRKRSRLEVENMENQAVTT